MNDEAGPWTQYQAEPQADGPWTQYQAAPQADGPWTQYQAEPAPAEEPSTIGAALRGAARAVLPTAGGFAAAGVGAELGAPLGPVGAIGGALAGALGGGAAIDWAQRKLGLVGGPQEEADIRAHPYASMAGQLGAALPFVGPGIGAGIPLAQRALGGGVMGGIEAGRQAVQGQFDPTQLALQAGGGALLAAPTTLGRAIQPGPGFHNLAAAFSRGALPELGQVAGRPATAPPPGFGAPSDIPAPPAPAEPRMPPLPAAPAREIAPEIAPIAPEIAPPRDSIEDRPLPPLRPNAEIAPPGEPPAEPSVGAAYAPEKIPEKLTDPGAIEDMLHEHLVSKVNLYMEEARQNIDTALKDPMIAYDPAQAKQIYDAYDAQDFSGLTKEQQAFADKHVKNTARELDQTILRSKQKANKLTPDQEQRFELGGDFKGAPRMSLNKSKYIKSANEGTPLARGEIADATSMHTTKHDVLEGPDGQRHVVERRPNTMKEVISGKTHSYEPKDFDYGSKVKVGKEDWTFQRATVDEIEAAEHAKTGAMTDAPKLYLRDPVIAYHYGLASAKANEARLDALFKLKNGLETMHFIKAKAQAPEGWKETRFPGLAGYKVLPRLGEILDDFTAPQRSGTLAQKAENAAHWLTGTLFLTGGLPHVTNVMLHIPFAAGWQMFNPRFFGRNWGLAFMDVLRGSELYKQVMDRGGQLFFSAVRNKDLPRRMMERMGHELQNDPVGSGLKGFAKQFGLTAAEAYRGYARKMSAGLWFGSDMITMQLIRSHMDSGMSLDQAMARVHDIPDYRIPSRIWEGPGGRVASKFLRYTPLNVFGRYHFNIAESFAKLAKQLAVGNKAQRIDAVGSVVALAAAYTAFKFGDALLEKHGPRDAQTGQPLQFRYPGLLGVPRTLEETARTGIRQNQDALLRTLGFEASPAAHMGGAVYGALAGGGARDWAGRRIVPQGSTVAQAIAAATDFALEQVAPTSQILGTRPSDFLGGLERSLTSTRFKPREAPPGGWTGESDRPLGVIASIVRGQPLFSKPPKPKTYHRSRS